MNVRRDRSGGTDSPQGDSRGQSAVLGMALLLGFTVVVGSTVAFAGMAIVQNGQDATQNHHAENEMATLASKIAKVGLGDSSMQQAALSSDDGEYRVEENAGTMIVEHVNYTDGEVETIDEVSLGAVVYENGDTVVAYEGGGVWSKRGDSASMVSPPEFHYRSGTLTLPIMNVTGDSQSTGKTEAKVTPAADTRHVYPNASATYDGDVDGEEKVYANPIENGTIRVTVESDYYKGWEQYFDERTTGEIEVDDENETVSVDLVTLGAKGDTDIREDEAIELRGYPETDPFNDFSLTLAGDGSSGLKNLDWNLQLDGDDFISIHNQGGDGTVEITDEDGTTWSTDAFDIEGKKEDARLTVNLTSYDDTHAVTDGSGRERKIGEVFNGRLEDHGSNADLTPEDSNGKQRVDHESSQLYIDFDGEARHITFLQITENQVEVELS